MSTRTIAVALSGGIDSLVAALRLKQSGCSLFGIHFLSGYENRPSGGSRITFDPPGKAPAQGTGRHPGVSPLAPDHPLTAASRALDIEILTLDCRQAFRDRIVRYFIEAYHRGDTPNPCVRCNQSIKFGLLLDTARELGAAQLATGHYAICEETAGHRYQLKRGKDPRKDQSYFLAMLDQAQLRRACFPLGSLTKRQVRAIADRNRLAPVAGGESQDICFVRNRHYVDFLSEHGEFVPNPGKIVDPAGNRIGTHQGLHRYTVGQRRGINCPATEPYYVLRLDVARNELVVGFKKDLYRSQCLVSGINWIPETPKKTLRVKTKIRYRHEPADSEIIPEGDDRATIRFSRPQPAITPGQAAVCYQGDAVIAGGWIYE